MRFLLLPVELPLRIGVASARTAFRVGQGVADRVFGSGDGDGDAELAEERRQLEEAREARRRRREERERAAGSGGEA